MRKGLNLSNRKRAASANSQSRKKKLSKLDLTKNVFNNLLDTEDFDSKVSQASFLLPNETNKSSIIELMDETRPNRLQQLQRTPDNPMPVTVGDILKKYPRFKDYNGEIIDREFLAIFPKIDSHLARLSTFYTPRILKYVAKTKPQLLLLVEDFKDDTVKALSLLPRLLPNPNYAANRKYNKLKSNEHYSSVIPSQQLLQFVNASDDLFSITPIQASSSKHIQPVLVCCMRGQDRKGSFYIKTDGHLIFISDEFLPAFDILFKLHYCFGVQFAPELLNFYDFIAACVYKIHKPKACSAALDATLHNLTIQE